MNDVLYLIDNKMSIDDIKDLYNKEQLNRAEYLLMLSTSSTISFYKFMGGMGPYKLYYDKNISDKSYWTNVSALLKAFYSLYKKFPNYHFDKLLSTYLEKNNSSAYVSYKFIEILDQHFKYKSSGIATFDIENVIEILNNCKKNIMNNRDYLIEEKTNNEFSPNESLLDVIKKSNNTFIDNLNYDLFKDSDDNSKHLWTYDELVNNNSSKEEDSEKDDI